MIQKFNVTLATILCGVTLANTGWATLVTLLVVKLTQNKDWVVSLSVILLTIFVLIFSETLPKLWAKKNPTKFLWDFYWAVYFLRYLLYPFVNLLSLIRFKRQIILIREREIIDLVQSLRNHPAIGQQEQNLVISAFNFDEKVLGQILTPFNQIKKISSDAQKQNQIYHLFFKYKYSRIPVFDRQKEKFIGVIRFKDLLGYMLKHKNQKPPSINQFILPIVDLTADTKLDEALRQMRTSKLHMVSVVHPKTKKLLGIATLEDVLEEIVGEIYDEKDIKPTVHEVGRNEWAVQPETKIIIFFKEQLHLKLDPEWEHWDLGQWFNYYCQKQNQNPLGTVIYKNFTFTTKEILVSNSNQKQKFILVRKLNPNYTLSKIKQ